jgi:hypothetical protein
MLTFDRRVQRKCEELINDRIKLISETILEGMLDPDRYKALTGQIRGLREALNLFEDAMSIAEGKPDVLHNDAET